MNKEKEYDILDNLINDKYEDIDKKKLNFKFLISPIITLIIISILLITSFVNVKRSILFSYLVFNNTMLIPLFLYTTLVLAFLYTLFVIIIYLTTKKEISALKLLAKIYKKADLIRFIDLLLASAFFMIVFIITPCNVIGDSMNDTLVDGNRVLTTDLFYDNPKIDDIVTFDCTNYVKSQTMLYIKRVVASKDAKIEYDEENMTILVNGEEKVFDINTLEYVRIYLTANDLYNVFELNNMSTSEILALDYEKSFIMPNGKALVFGDNRGNSRDSEEFGAISTKDIFGHVLFRFGNKIETKIKY